MNYFVEDMSSDLDIFGIHDWTCPLHVGNHELLCRGHVQSCIPKISRSLFVLHSEARSVLPARVQAESNSMTVMSFFVLTGFWR